MKAYTQLIENKVMVSTLTKPDFRTLNPIYTGMDIQEMTNEFESSILGEVENARHFPDSALSKMTGHEYYVKIGELISQILENDPCEVEKSGDKYIIKSI